MLQYVYEDLSYTKYIIMHSIYLFGVDGIQVDVMIMGLPENKLR